MPSSKAAVASSPCPSQRAISPAPTSTGPVGATVAPRGLLGPVGPERVESSVQVRQTRQSVQATTGRSGDIGSRAGLPVILVKLRADRVQTGTASRSEEHTSELQSPM